ncbi:hypothetical protein OKW46_003473 [Paraburkholderia sp. WSM4179]|nr:hypothetical protein [Paraburkholderia sp. WSM4179]
MSTTSYEVPEPLVDTRVRSYVESMSALCGLSRSHPVCEGQSIQFEGAPWEPSIAALRSRFVQGPFPVR